MNGVGVEKPARTSVPQLPPNNTPPRVLTSTDNLSFEQKYEKYQTIYLKILSVLVAKFSIYLKRRVFVMSYPAISAKYRIYPKISIGTDRSEQNIVNQNQTRLMSVYTVRHISSRF